MGILEVILGILGGLVVGIVAWFQTAGPRSSPTSSMSASSAQIILGYSSTMRMVSKSMLSL